MSAVTVSASDFVRALTAAKAVVASKIDIPALSCALISASNGRLEVKATDLTQSVAFGVACEGSGKWLLNHDRLQAFASALPKSGVVRITGEGLGASLRCGTVSCRIPGLDPSIYPEITDKPRFDCAPVSDGVEFPQLVNRIAAACDTEGSYALRGVHVLIRNGICRASVAASAIMATETRDCPADVLVDKVLDVSTASTIAQLFTTGPVWIVENEGSIWVENNSLTYHSKTVDAVPPDVASIAANAEATASIDTASLLRSLKATQLVSHQTTRAVYLSTSPDDSYIGATTIDGTLCVPFDADGGATIAAAVNGDKMRKIITAAGVETVTIGMSSKSGIVNIPHIQVSAGRFFGLIAPMQIEHHNVDAITSARAVGDEMKAAA